MQQKSATPEPNLYQLSGNGVHITYTTSGIDGQAHLQYQDAHGQAGFLGDNLRVQQSEIGTLVTVYLRRTVDTGSTTLTLCIPRVGLDAGHRADIKTQAIRTVHRFSVVPAFNQGQRDLYEVIPLTGTAAFVLF